jgi:hypothetical protein
VGVGNPAEETYRYPNQILKSFMILKNRQEKSTPKTGLKTAGWRQAKNNGKLSMHDTCYIGRFSRQLYQTCTESAAKMFSSNSL